MNRMVVKCIIILTTPVRFLGAADPIPVPPYDIGATHYTATSIYRGSRDPHIVIAIYPDRDLTCQVMYIHTNHYKYTPGAKEVYNPHSMNLDMAAKGKATPENMAGLCNILNDTSHSEYQIYRVPGQARCATLPFLT